MKVIFYQISNLSMVNNINIDVQYFISLIINDLFITINIDNFNKIMLMLFSFIIVQNISFLIPIKPKLFNMVQYVTHFIDLF